jgi:hypothetical protein
MRRTDGQRLDDRPLAECLRGVLTEILFKAAPADTLVAYSFDTSKTSFDSKGGVSGYQAAGLPGRANDANQ